MVKTGGISDEKAMTDEVLNVVNPHKEAILEMAKCAHVDSWEPRGYASQVVAGTNYFVKVLVDEAAEICVHVRIFVPLPSTGGSSELVGVEYPKKADEAITYF